MPQWALFRGGRRLLRNDQNTDRTVATPSQAVLNFDDGVTQWMSRVIRVCGSALNSDQFHALTGRGPTFSVKVQSAGSIRGAGPAVSTGRLSTRCCPGGIRSASSDPAWRPVKPRVTVAVFLRAGNHLARSRAAGAQARTVTNAARRGRCPRGTSARKRPDRAARLSVGPRSAPVHPARS